MPAALTAAADPKLGGHTLDHFYDSGLFAHAFNIAATALSNHAAVLPVGDDPIGVGPASFDASYTPAWMQAGACDFFVKPASPERITVSIRNALSMGASGSIFCRGTSLSTFGRPIPQDRSIRAANRRKQDAASFSPIRPMRIILPLSGPRPAPTS